MKENNNNKKITFSFFTVTCGQVVKRLNLYFICECVCEFVFNSLD